MTYPHLVLRNLLRHPLRSILTTLSIALSIFLVCAVLTLPSALEAILEQAASNVRISVHHKAGLTYWLPQSYLQRVKTIPGVDAVNEYSWFGGVYDEPKNMFPNFAIDPETVGPGTKRMVHDLPGGEGRFVARPRGIAATLVNGELTREHGESTGAASGSWLRRGAA